MQVDRDRIVEDLQDVVSIPSVTGTERRVQERMAMLMEEATLSVEVIETDPEQLASDPDFPGIEVPRTDLPVVVGRYSSGRPGPTRMLLGHIDVVPTGDPATWETPPWEPHVADGLLYGRGACDMKGGVVAMLEAVRVVLESGSDLNGDLVVVTVPAEEDGGSGALAAIRAGCTADMAVIPEPTGLDVVVAHAGAITFTIRVPGKAAHASTRLAGVSALDKLRVVLDALEADERTRNESEEHPLMKALGLPYPTIIGMIEGGSWASTVMDAVEVDGRYGVRLGQTAAEAELDLRAAVEKAWSGDPFLAGHPLDLDVWGGRFDSCSVPADSPLPQSVAAAHQRLTGETPEFLGAPYGADMRLLINQGHTPTVMYGPGHATQAHTANEFVPLEQVYTCAAVLADWLSES